MLLTQNTCTWQTVFSISKTIFYLMFKSWYQSDIFPSSKYLQWLPTAAAQLWGEFISSETITQCLKRNDKWQLWNSWKCTSMLRWWTAAANDGMVTLCFKLQLEIFSSEELKLHSRFNFRFVNRWIHLKKKAKILLSSSNSWVVNPGLKRTGLIMTLELMWVGYMLENTCSTSV